MGVFFKLLIQSLDLLFVLLDCTLKAFRPCTCPASRLQEDPEISGRDIKGLMDGGSYMSEAMPWSDTPLCVPNGRQDMAAVLAPRGRGRLQVIGGIYIKLIHQLPGKLAGGHAPHCPFDKLSWWRCSDLKIRIITSWGQGQVCWKVTHVSSM